MKKLILTTAIALVGLSLPAPEAQAGSWATQWQLNRTNKILDGSRRTQRETRDAINDVRQEVRESADRLIAALRLQTGEQSAYQDKAIEAGRRVTDAAQQNDSQRLRQEFRAKAESGENDPAVDVCLLAGLFRGSDGGGPTAAGDDAVGSRLTESAKAKASGEDPAVMAGGTMLAKSLVDDRLKHQGSMGYADPTTDPAVILEKPTLPMETDEEKAAVERLIRNMTDPMPPRPVTAEELRTPEGQSRSAKRTIQLTRSNAAQESLAMVMNMRAKVGSSESYRPYVEDIADYNRDLGESISELQGLDIRTLRYYAPTPEVANERANQNEKSWRANMLDAIAIGNRIAYLQLELDSRRAVVETQILSTLANGS